MKVASVVGPVRRWARSVVPERRSLREDFVAGVPNAVASVPDGMASALVAGVNPVAGLYASIGGPIAGGLAASTRVMIIATTTAAALAAGSAIEGVATQDRDEAMFLVTALAGVIMVAAGLVRLGRYTRFVSHSVMMGFLTGVSLNILFGQVPDLTGASADGDTSLAKILDVVLHPSTIDGASSLCGFGALALLIVSSRVGSEVIGSLAALVLPTVAVLVLGADSVARVDDIGSIPAGLPLPQVPDLGLLSVSIVTGAFAVAAIVLVQGAGVAEAAPNRAGPRSDANQDFIAQGVGNVASGLLKGIPVGGSVGQTALNVTAGARSRWASIWSGLWMIVILVGLSAVVGEVVMPTLAAILIYASVAAIRPGELRTVLRTGALSQIALIGTFVATLFLPVAAAVAIGVALSLLLQLNRDAMDLRVVEVTIRPDGAFEERRAPDALRSGEVTVLDVYGSLLYAGSRTLQVRLPSVGDAAHPAVVLRLRGRTSLGATFFKVVAEYADKLAAADGRLYLSGLAPDLVDLAHHSGRIAMDGPVQLYEATPIVGESTRLAATEADAWEVRVAEGQRPPD